MSERKKWWGESAKGGKKKGGEIGRVWHLWQQKINIAVGRRARARVRRVCVWICTFSKKGRFRRRGAWETLFGFILFGSLFLWCFAHLRKQNKVYQKKIAQILADFSLFALVSTHIVIEGNVKEQQQVGELTKRKAGENRETLCRKTQWKKKQRKKKQSAPNEFDTLCKDLKD